MCTSKKINALGTSIYEEPEQSLPIAFRNCVVVIMGDKDKTVRKIYTDIQFMKEWKKEQFMSLAQDIPVGVFILELEQEITRIGFRL